MNASNHPHHKIVTILVILAFVLTAACTKDSRKTTVKPKERGEDKPLSEQSKKWPFYKNERFAYIVQHPANWKKFEAQNGDGITLSKNKQKILVYGNNDINDDKTLDKRLRSDELNKYISKIKSKKKLEVVNTTGYLVKTSSQEFAIFKSWQSFVYVYVDLPAEDSTIKIMQEIARSFQVLGE